MKIFKGTLRKPEIKIEVKNWDHSEVIRERKISRDKRIYPINPSKPEPVVYKDQHQRIDSKSLMEVKRAFEQCNIKPNTSDDTKKAKIVK